MVTLMNGLNRARFEPVLLALDDRGPLRTQIAHDIPVHHMNGCRVSRALPGLYKNIRDMAPDIVISTLTHMNISTLALRPLFPRTRFVVREAAMPSRILKAKPSIAWIIMLGYRLLYPWANLVIVPSCAIMEDFLHLGVPVKNHALLCNPADETRLRNAATLTHDGDSPRENTVRFVAAGRLFPAKGFDRLIEALPDLRMGYNWHLTILGHGPDREKLEGMIRDRNLSDRVSLPGFLENPWTSYAGADCFLLPSRSEGLPNVALESLACGTPVIAMHEAGGITDIAPCAAPGAVTVAPDMEAFLRAMEKITPQQKSALSPSLLPSEFKLENVISAFSDMLENTGKKARTA